jgi:hypothetical protein
MDVITLLKTNKKAFCKMDDVLRVKAGQIGTDEFQRLNQLGNWVQVCQGKNGEFKLNLTYRLRIDYTPPIELIECEIVNTLINEDYYIKKYRDTDKQLYSIDVFPDGCVLAGFKFEGRTPLINKDFGYSHNSRDIIPFAEYDGIKSGKLKVLHASHVVFIKS